MLNGNRTKSETARNVRDFYPTEPGLCAAGVRLIPWPHLETLLDAELCIIDAGAGTGNWGIAMRDLLIERQRTDPIIGVELFPSGNPPPAAYDRYIYGDFLTAELPPSGVVISNPPFSMAEAFVRRALDLLPTAGVLLLLQRLDFAATQKRGRGLFRQSPPCEVHVCVTRPSFTGDGNTDTIEYGLFLWIKGWRGETSLHWLDWCPQGRPGGKQKRRAPRHPDQLTMFAGATE